MSLLSDKVSFASDLLDIFENSCNFDSDGKIRYKGTLYDCDKYLAYAFYDRFKTFIEGATITTGTESGTSSAGSYSGTTTTKNLSITTDLKTELYDLVFSNDKENFETHLAKAVVDELSKETTITTICLTGVSVSGNVTTPTTSKGSGGLGFSETSVTSMASNIRSCYSDLTRLAKRSNTTIRQINKVLVDNIVDTIYNTITGLTTNIDLSLTPTGSGSVSVKLS